MLERALAAVRRVGRTVVVGPRGPAHREVDFVVEDPPSGGPAAGLLAGLDHLVATSAVPPVWLVVLAVDMPFVSENTLTRLFAATGSPRVTRLRHTDGTSEPAHRMTQPADRGDGAVLVDGEGRAQLCAVVRREALERVRPAGPATGLGFFQLLHDLELVHVTAHDREAVDVDTPEDLRRITDPT